MYALHARGLHKATDPQAKLRVLGELKAKLKGKSPAAAEFEPAFLNLRYSRSFTKQRKLIHYVLAKIDSRHTSGVTLDYQHMKQGLYTEDRTPEAIKDLLGPRPQRNSSMDRKGDSLACTMARQERIREGLEGLARFSAFLPKAPASATGRSAPYRRNPQVRR